MRSHAVHALHRMSGSLYGGMMPITRHVVAEVSACLCNLVSCQIPGSAICRITAACTIQHRFSMYTMCHRQLLRHVTAGSQAQYIQAVWGQVCVR